MIRLLCVPVRVLRVSVLAVFLASTLLYYRAANDSAPGEEGLLARHDAIAAERGVPAPLLYESPVLDQNFPDPAVIQVDGVFYAFATNGNRNNIAAARSDDLVAWTLLPDAMPQFAPWALPVRGLVWAPEVIEVAGSYLMYYTARDRASGRQCIGVAASALPEGPYTDGAESPLLCPAGMKGAIDPNPYQDEGTLYLYFSTCCGEPNAVYAQALSADGHNPVGSPVLLLRPDHAWEGTIVEAPTMVDRGGDHYLFYSGNDYRTDRYAVGYAVCESALGPCSKAPENPILSGGAGSQALGPGHQYIVAVGSEYWMLYHAWSDVVGYRNGGRRALWLTPLTWRDDKPIVTTPGANTRG
jgi:beta-xylosidase